MWVKFDAEKAREMGYLFLYETWAKKYNIDLSLPYLSKKSEYGIFRIKIESEKFLKASTTGWATATECLFAPCPMELDLNKFM